MQSTHQNEDIHYFASNLIVERVPCQNLSTTSPRKDIRTLPNSAFLLKNDEECKLRQDFKVLVGRVLVSSIPSLAFLKSVIPRTYQSYIRRRDVQKTVIVPLPMQLKDEKKYSDIVDIPDYYEDELENIYIKAGVVEKPADISTVAADVSTVAADVSTVPADVSTVPADVSTVQPISIEGQSLLPDQPGAHFTKVDENDHMKVISVPFGGDQLTCVGFAGAKDLRAGSHTAKERLEHCSPFVSELFHTKMSYLQVFKNKSANVVTRSNIYCVCTSLNAALLFKFHL